MSQGDTRKPCRYCGCPEASAKDWEEVEPGKGEELGLCWDGEACRHDPERAIDRLMQERDAARKDADRLVDAIKHSDRFNDTRHFGGDAQLNAALASHEAIAKK